MNDNGIHLFLENNNKYMWIAYNLVYALVLIGIHSPWIPPPRPTLTPCPQVVSPSAGAQIL